MKILLTGANGFVGARIRAAAPVICAPSLRGAEKEDIDRLIDTVQPDAILHTAAISDIGACAKDPEGSYHANVLIPEYLAKAANGAKLVLFSSDQVYSGAKGDKPFTEDDVATANLYAEEKLEMENRVLAIDPNAVMLRAAWMYKNEKVWQKGQPKAYYTELTDTLRTYIKDRFGFNALEMTSSEIIDKLLEMNDKEAISDLKELFQTADLVKFAKHDPQMNENDANLINAIDFINETKQPEEENQKPQPTEITIIEKRSLRTKILLICGIVFLSAALIGTFVYIGMQLYDLFA